MIPSCTACTTSTGGGIEYTYDELVDALNAEAATLPPETWRDGVWDVNDYMIEAMPVGIIETVGDDEDDDDAVDHAAAELGA